MYTIREWFLLVDNPFLRGHLLNKLSERREFIQNRVVKDFPTALNYGFSWEGRYNYYKDLFDNPPKLRIVLFYRVKILIRNLN